MRDLDPERPIGREIRRVVRRRIRSSIELLGSVRSTTDPLDRQLVDAVHTVRRHAKEIRALLRLLDDVEHGPTHRTDRRVRRAAHALGPIRDAQVAADLAEAGTDVATAGTDAGSLDVEAAVDRALASLERARRSAHRISAGNDLAPVRRGIRRATADSADAFERARRDPTPARMHRWRIEEKRRWYQVRALAVASPALHVPLAELLEALGETLGELHDVDLAHQRASAAGEPPSDERERARDELATRALRWGASVHAEPARAFADRIVRSWTIAAGEGPEPPLSR